VKKFPEKFIGAAVLPVDNEAVLQNELKRATGQLGLRAVSLASSYNGTFLDEPLFLPLYEFAQKHQMPIFVHSQIVNPIGFERVNDSLLTPVIEYIFDTTMCIGKLLMSGILKNYPDVKFVFANFGGALGLLQHRFDATYQMLRSINFVKDLGGNPTQYLKNIYVDTGGDTLSANYQLALDLLGPRHILWGSDWPAKRDVAASINSVKQLGLAASDIEAILGGNAAALLRF
jgi:aminocarboxymuconate-semialdehyde decarboxylase